MEKINKLHLALSGILSGLLLWASWPDKGFPFIIFIAFVPLLIIDHIIWHYTAENKSIKLFLFIFPAFLIWNFLTSFWIHKATLAGAIATVFLNSLMMFLPFLLYHKLSVVMKRRMPVYFIAVFWLGLEYLFLNWDLAWPWLNIGNVFATVPQFVQWYEFTGIFGGAVWIWIINILVFNILLIISPKLQTLKFSMSFNIISYIILLIIFIIVPVIISFSIKNIKSEEIKGNIVIVQPNIDPYHEKFASGTFTEQLQTLIRLSESQADSNTLLFVWPETALSLPFDEERFLESNYTQVILEFLAKYPNAKLISGIDSYKFFKKGEKLSETARFNEYDSSYYDAYNAAVFMDFRGRFEFYHKSILVPGVEKMPYPKVFKFLSRLTIDLGGTSGSLGKQAEPSVFQVNEKITAAPIICYESVFGNYVSKFVKKKANLITIMTNDGWWGNTAGHRQHFQYARLRAIETGKYIVRSANTGISGYIDPEGNIIEQTKFWEEAAIKVPVLVNDKLTFYTRTGDYLGRIAAFTSVLLLILLISKGLIKKKPL